MLDHQQQQLKHLAPRARTSGMSRSQSDSKLPQLPVTHAVPRTPTRFAVGVGGFFYPSYRMMSLAELQGKEAEALLSEHALYGGLTVLPDRLKVRPQFLLLLLCCRRMPELFC